MKTRAWIVLIVVFGGLWTLPASESQAREWYYVLIFGSESHPKQLRYTHTWATAVRAVGEGTDPNAYTIEAHTISWLPATLEVRVWRPWPEPGANLTLEQTLATVHSSGQSVTMWGPFLINRQVYERGLAIIQIGESGQAQYRAISTGRNMLISDCVHAVAAADPIFGRRHYPLIRIGKPASRHIAREIMIRSDIDQSLYDNSWLIPRLGLDRYPIEVIPPQQIPAHGCFLCLRRD